MGSNNFLNVKTLISEFKEHSLKDNISEASESGTSNSVTSAEDLQKLVVILGLNSVEDVHQERFRVDRRRLEAMLADNLEESQTAQSFFHRVMTETDTLINWPARLKIGARSKKDPHVRVAGRADDVRRAREKIMQLLDTRSNRVTMKIDVSYTDHSHIIGKGGATIKRVMTDTGCHIHFPDSNRTSALEKSNQVSIAGDMANVERARARVRMLTPLVFSFELPIMASSQQPDVCAPYVLQVQEQYHVQVMLRNRPKLHANMVVVKGNQWEVDNVTEATTLLMHYMCGNIASQTQVQMSLEISPIHHGIVVGRGAEQLKVIMKGTNTQIMFPDADDPNIPVIRKSCVTITGAINNVYNARQQLVGSLPVVVIFDVADDRCSADADTVSRLMQQLSVYINVRRKPKQGIASVVIKGIERSAGDIYEARRQLLNGAEPSISVQIPESYTIPELGAVPFSAFNPFSPSHGHSISSMINSPCSPYVPDLGFGSPMYGHNPPTPGGFPSPLSPGLWAGARGPLYPHSPHYAQHWDPLTSPDMGMPQMMQYHYPQPQHDNRQPTLNQLLTTNPVSQLLNTTNPVAQLLNMNSPRLPVTLHHSPRPSTNMSNNMSNASNNPDIQVNQLEVHPASQLDTSNPTSGYQSNFTGSSASLDANNVSGTDTSHVASPSVSPISKSHSPERSADNDRSQQEIASIIQELPLSERRAPGCEKKTLETMKMSPLADYRHKQAEANKCMRAAAGGWRVPSSRWAGQLFSRTSPAPLTHVHTPERAWNRSEMGIPNIKLESPPGVTPLTPTATPAVTPAVSPAPCRYRQLSELLLDRGLNKYCEIFERHEVDVWAFASLDEADLTELGVTAFGARRRMLLLIAELKKRAGASKGSSSAEKKIIKSPPHYTALPQDKW